MRALYISPGPLDDKAHRGLSEFARYWPGDFVASVPSGEVPKADYETRICPDPTDAIAQIRPDIVLALLRPEFSMCADLARTVYTAEFNRKIRTDIQLADADGPTAHTRIRLGQLRLERRYRDMATRAAGLQCNGPEAARSYARLSARPLTFQDHRIYAPDLERSRRRATWDGSQPLRAAFSGRLIRAKGADLIPAIARLAPNVHFDILGDGELRGWLERNSPDNVTLRGYVPFDDWMEYMRDNIDIAVLPHRQGDPSCTYFEALGCGVPVVGLRNPTWRFYARHGLGWAESNVADIANRLRSITPDELSDARVRGLQSVEPFEQVAQRRVAHLYDAAAR